MRACKILSREVEKRMSPHQLVISLTKKYIAWITCILLLGFVEALLNSAGTALIVPAVFAYLGLIDPAKILPNRLVSHLTVSSNLYSQILPLLVLGIFLVKDLIGPCSVAVKTDLLRRIQLELRTSMLENFLHADLSLIQKFAPGDILHRLGHSVSAVAATFGTSLDGVRLIFSALVLGAILVSLSWKLTALALLLALSLILALSFSSKRSHRLGKFRTKAARLLGIHANDLIDGIRTIKERGCEESEFRRLIRILRVREKAHFVSALHVSLSESFSEFAALTILFLALLVMHSSPLAVDKSILLIYLPVLFRLMPTLHALGSVCLTLSNSYPELTAVCDFINESNQRHLKHGTRQLDSLREGIEFENLKFSYPKNKHAVFDDLSLRIEKGTTVAIVGISGVGKTTLCDLLLRFYDPEGGRIILDGVDLKQFDLHSIRRKIAVVSQNNYLFARSIRANITLGAKGVSREQFQAAVTTTGLEDIARALPNGLNTLIGARGSSLSLGERQRVAIARAIVNQPEILILDEATGAVDPVMDKQIHAALKQLGPQCTRIIISHRPSTIRQADIIALISKGKIAELGNHDELMKQKGAYARIYGDD